MRSNWASSISTIRTASAPTASFAPARRSSLARSETVEIALEFTPETAKLAAARAAVCGAEPERGRDEDHGQIVPISTTLLKALRRPPWVERQPGDGTRSLGVGHRA